MKNLLQIRLETCVILCSLVGNGTDMETRPSMHLILKICSSSSKINAGCAAPTAHNDDDGRGHDGLLWIFCDSFANTRLCNTCEPATLVMGGRFCRLLLLSPAYLIRSDLVWLLLLVWILWLQLEKKPHAQSRTRNTV
jgi:hypothetical protein